MKWIKKGRIFTADEGGGWMKSHAQIPSADKASHHRLPLAQIPGESGYVFEAVETYDPPTAPLDASLWRSIASLFCRNDSSPTLATSSIR